MANPTLVIFIDAYPYWVLPGSRLFNVLPVVRAMRPGFGYSINCQTELFTGNKPDDVGYWCEYAYLPNSKDARNRALGLLDLIRPFRIPNRACHKIVERILRKPLKDIPFSHLNYFTRSGKELFARDFPFDSILKRANVHVFSYLDFPQLPTPAERDRCIFESASRALADASMRGLVLALGNLDHVGHWYHPGSDPYLAARDEIELKTVNLIDAFQAKFSDGTVFVISDHGMAPVHSAMDPGLEKPFGKPRPDRYVYFVEGTILRIWSRDTQLKVELSDYLNRMKNVEIISHQERTEFGIRTPSFGDIIAVTDEGVMWVPSFWGALPSKGMHGYHPRYEQQLGIFCSNRDIQYSDPILRATQVAAILNQAIPPACNHGLYSGHQVTERRSETREL